ATRLASVVDRGDSVRATLDGGETLAAPALIGCDGLWSRVRQAVAGSAAPLATGHVAYRGLILAQALPQAMRALRVQVWLGPRLHVVLYPVRRGEAFNVVAVVHARPSAAHDAQAWSQPATRADLQ